MDREPIPALQRAYRLALLFWGFGCIGPLPIYILVNAIVRGQSGFATESPIAPDHAYLILIGLAALTAVLIKPMSRRMLTRDLPINASYPFVRLSRHEMKLFTITGTISAMTHTTAVVGFVLAFLIGEPIPLYLGVLLSLALLLLYYPRYHQWAEWAAAIGD